MRIAISERRVRVAQAHSLGMVMSGSWLAGGSTATCGMALPDLVGGAADFEFCLDFDLKKLSIVGADPSRRRSRENGRAKCAAALQRGLRKRGVCERAGDLPRLGALSARKT